MFKKYCCKSGVYPMGGHGFSAVFCFFALVFIWIYRKDSTENYEQIADLALDDNELFDKEATAN